MTPNKEGDRPDVVDRVIADRGCVDCNLVSPFSCLVGEKTKVHSNCEFIDDGIHLNPGRIIYSVTLPLSV